MFLRYWRQPMVYSWSCMFTAPSSPIVSQSLNEHSAIISLGFESPLDGDLLMRIATIASRHICQEILD